VKITGGYVGRKRYRSAQSARIDILHFDADFQMMVIKYAEETNSFVAA
jgi:hypothetical protein